MSIMVDNRPSCLWYLIIGHEVGAMKITPTLLLHCTNSNRLTDRTLDLMHTVVVSTMAINKMMGRAETFGA